MSIWQSNWFFIQMLVLTVQVVILALKEVKDFHAKPTTGRAHPVHTHFNLMLFKRD